METATAGDLVVVERKSKVVKVEKPVEDKVFSIKYQEADVTLETTSRLYGGMPQSEELLRDWIKAKGPIPEESLEEKIEAMTPGEINEQVERSSTGFRTDEKGVYFLNFMIKQMLKEAATAVGLFKKNIGTKTNLTIGFVVKPERIHVGRMQPDGYEEFQGRVNGPRGPVSILSRKAYFEPGLVIRFSIKMLAGRALTMENVKQLLDHAGEFVGFGSSRSREAGKFQVVEFETK